MYLSRYQHYKGNFYEVIGIARDCETLEEMIVYKALYNSPDFGDGALWIRKKSDFLAQIEKDGVKIARFRSVD